jgi:hypothetical protein
MSEDNTINICIATTSDIVVERNIVREVCNGLNDNKTLNHLGISFHTVLWEDMYSSVHDTQEVMDRLLNECDVFICILYRRIDSSSTKNENDELNALLSDYDSWKTLKKPQFVFFFKEVKVSSMKDITDPQLIRVFALKEKIIKESTLHHYDFSAPYELCEKIYDYMENWLNENSKSK